MSARSTLGRGLAWLGVLSGALLVVLLVVYFVLPQNLMKAAGRYQTWRAHLTERAVLAGDTRWVYDEGGRGPTLILLHGYMDDRSVWLSMAPFLAPHFHLIIPDLPGWGDSSRVPKADYGYAAQADRVHAFIDALHLDHFAVAGHSMGGGIAGVYASKYPEGLTGLVLIDSAGAAFNENAFMRKVSAGENPLRGLDRASFERAARLGFKHPPRLPGRFEDALIEGAIQDRAFNDRVFSELLAPSQRNVLGDALHSVNVPTVAIWCREDQIIDVSALETIRHALTGAPRIDVTELDDCGHMVNVERPRAVAEAITQGLLNR